jgi:AbrB family looped-hinge helix DNA binding protein
VKEIVSTVDSAGRVVLPAEVRRHLGVAAGDTIAFVVGSGGVQVRPVGFTLDAVFGSVEPLPGPTSADFEREIEAATEDEAERVAAKLRGPCSKS